MSYNSIINKIKEKEIRIGIIGLGYVGLPLAVTFAKAQLTVLGFEKNNEKAEKVNQGINYIADVDDDELKSVVGSGKFSATTEFSELKNCNAIIICVPTPLDKFKKPNMDYIEKACIEIGKNMDSGTFICLESTSYPSTTEDFMLPIIKKHSQMEQGKDFWLAFSPERVDPGNKTFKTHNTPKILGAMSEEGKKIGFELYSLAIENIHLVSSPKVAEMVKILENTYRLVNISLINELALLANRMDIDIWEVIDAAKTKPYGFQAFYPGPGVGGHCIPLDPFYLEHIAKRYNFDLTMIHTAGQIDNLMPHRMMVRINFALNKHKKAINGSNVLFLGAAYKADISDERESPTLKIIDEVVRKGGLVDYHDPYIDSIETDQGHRFESVSLSEAVLRKADCVVITTRHEVFDYSFIKEYSNLIVDLRNGYEEKSEKIIKL